MHRDEQSRSSKHEVGPLLPPDKSHDEEGRLWLVLDLPIRERSVGWRLLIAFVSALAGLLTAMYVSQ